MWKKILKINKKEAEVRKFFEKFFDLLKNNRNNNKLRKKSLHVVVVVDSSSVINQFTLNIFSAINLLLKKNKTAHTEI